MRLPSSGLRSLEDGTKAGIAGDKTYRKALPLSLLLRDLNSMNDDRGGSGGDGRDCAKQQAARQHATNSRAGAGRLGAGWLMIGAAPRPPKNGASNPKGSVAGTHVGLSRAGVIEGA